MSKTKVMWEEEQDRLQEIRWDEQDVEYERQQEERDNMEQKSDE
jgi:hypothetical protein